VGKLLRDVKRVWAKKIAKFILIFVQRDATQNSLFIILQVHSTYFGCQPHPSSGVHKTLTTATSLQRGQAWPRWREVAAQKYDQYRRL